MNVVLEPGFTFKCFIKKGSYKSHKINIYKRFCYIETTETLYGRHKAWEKPKKNIFYCFPLGTSTFKGSLKQMTEDALALGLGKFCLVRTIFRMDTQAN